MEKHGTTSNKANGDLFDNSGSLFSDLDLPTLSSSMNATHWFDENASIFAPGQMDHTPFVINQQANGVGNLSGSPLFISSNGCNLSLSNENNQVINVSNPSKSPYFGLNCSFGTTISTQGLSTKHVSNPLRSQSSLFSNYNKRPLLLGSTSHYSPTRNQSQTHCPPHTFASNPNLFGSKSYLSIANYSSTTTIPFLCSSSSSIYNPHRNQLGFAPNVSISTSSIENPVSKYQMSMSTSSTPSYNNFETLHQCNLCPRVFSSSHALGGHMSSHTRARKRRTLIDDILNNRLGDNNITQHRCGLALTISDGDNPDLSIEVYSSVLPNKKMKYLEEHEETNDHGVVIEDFFLLSKDIGIDNLFDQTSVLVNHGSKENNTLEKLEDPPKKINVDDYDASVEGYLEEHGDETITS